MGCGSRNVAPLASRDREQRVSTVVPLHRKRQLATRIRVGSYYTDGRALFEIAGIGATGCVTVRSAWNGGTRCFDITDFRRMFWLVRDPGESEAA